MYIDLLGKKRYKVNLHCHTTLSDGKRTPEEAAQIYLEQGYDALAITDHWRFGQSGEINGLHIISGAEYNFGLLDPCDGIYHIVGVGMKQDPAVERAEGQQAAIDAIHRAGGVAILAHPAWSLNTPQQILGLKDLDGTEIYNSVSGVHNSRRPDSSLIVDMVACYRTYLPLLATDDTHFYDGDQCMSWIMVEADELTNEALMEAIRARRFYATQGPEVHLMRDGNGFRVKCTPCEEIVFLSNVVITKRAFAQKGITEAYFEPAQGERYVRAVVRDEQGRYAWSNIIAYEN